MIHSYSSGIANPDQKIHRFIRLPHFRQLVGGELVLVRPSVWEDPFEILFQRAMVTDKRSIPWLQYPLGTVLENVFAQSWSLNEDSDTYLRAYSSVRKDSEGRNADAEFEAVRITTTPRKLQSAVMQALSQAIHDADVFVVVGGVRYVDGERIKTAIACAAKKHEKALHQKAKRTADLCLLKRLSFNYECEVRLLVIFSGVNPTGALLPLSVDPALFVDEVAFDPRLATGERLERAEILRDTSLKSRVVDREQYQGVLLQIIVE